MADQKTSAPKVLILESGDFLFEEGNSARFAYILLDGNMEIVKNTTQGEQILGNVDKNAVFGEMAIIDSSPRSASARASSKCKVQEVDHNAFLQYVSKKPEAALNMMKRLSGYVRAADKKVGGRMTDSASDSLQNHVDTVSTDKNKINNIIDTESIYSSPPSRPVIITAISILSFIIIISIWASLTFVDKTVSSRGKFSNLAPNVEIQSTGSSVIKELNLDRGQFVKTGEIIAMLDGTVVNANLKIVEDKIKIIKNKLLSLKLEKDSYINNKLPEFTKYNISLISKDILTQKFKNYIYKNKNFDSEKIKLSSEIDLNEKDVNLLREQLSIKIKLEEGKKKLFKNNVGSLMDSLVSTDQRISLNRELQTKLNTIQSLKLKRTNLSDEKKSYLNDLLVQISEKISDHNDQLLQLEEELVKTNLEKENLSVKSPVDGIVLESPKITIGSLINKGDPIVTIVRTGLPLILEIDVVPKDISDVYYGNVVSVKIDSLPFQQYGDLSGTLTFLSDDTVEESLQGEKGAFYRGRVDISDSEMLQLPEGFDLTPGMLASADLKVGERRLITYFTNPILKSLATAMREPD